MSGRRVFVAGLLLVASAAAVDGQYAGDALGDARIELAGAEYAPAALERGQNVTGTVKLPEAVPAKGAGITVRISDSLGRLLVDRRLAIPAGGSFTEVPLDVPVPNALAQRHYINAVVTRPGAPALPG